METKLNVKLLSHTMNPELIIATAGKLCYSPANINDLLEKQTEESIEKFVKMLVSMGHESPLEHASFNFAIEGVSRSLTHQLVRHRLASYSQQSQRYVKETQFDYIIPDDIKRNSLLTEEYVRYMENTQKMYDIIVENLILDYVYNEIDYGDFLLIQLKKLGIDTRSFYEKMNAIFQSGEELETLRTEYKKLYSIIEKKAIENARYVFPNATETKIIVTMNLRTLINFCHHRCCNRAQEEINKMAWEMVKAVEEVSPLLAKFLGASCQFGQCPEGAMCCMKPYPKKNKAA